MASIGPPLGRSKAQAMMFYIDVDHEHASKIFMEVLRSPDRNSVADCLSTTASRLLERLGREAWDERASKSADGKKTGTSDRPDPTKTTDAVNTVLREELDAARAVSDPTSFEVAEAARAALVAQCAVLHLTHPDEPHFRFHLALGGYTPLGNTPSGLPHEVSQTVLGELMRRDDPAALPGSSEDPVRKVLEGIKHIGETSAGMPIPQPVSIGFSARAGPKAIAWIEGSGLVRSSMQDLPVRLCGGKTVPDDDHAKTEAAATRVASGSAAEESRGTADGTTEVTKGDGEPDGGAGLTTASTSPS